MGGPLVSVIEQLGELAQGGGEERGVIGGENHCDGGGHGDSRRFCLRGWFTIYETAYCEIPNRAPISACVYSPVA
ncbi:hypothetical protein TPB0596_46460 [Tsukamurella pulmonis]|nr:hypothetical protein TPB0596_46460 [Tsukamurella pulmonis]